MNLMNTLHDEYGEHFSQVFKTITVDNGSEFADFARWRTGAARFSSPIRTPPRSVLRTSDTMACSGPLSQRELLSRASLTRISSPLLTS